MTSALIALVFLVVWYGGMLLAFWLIDRQIDDEVGTFIADGQAERRRRQPRERFVERAAKGESLEGKTEIEQAGRRRAGHRGNGATAAGGGQYAGDRLGLPASEISGID